MWILQNPFKRKPKTRFSIQEFSDAVRKVREEQNSGHHCVYIQLSGHDYSEIELRGYIDNPPRSEEGKTIEEVCEKLRQLKPEPSPVKEVSF